MLSALSRVVDLTDVKIAASSFNCLFGAPMSPAAALKTPPVLLITEIRSSDSTANLLATAFKEPRTESKSLAFRPN